MSDPILFEALYQGERHVGFGLPEPGTEQTLYRVADGQLAAAFIATDGSADAIKAAVTEGAETVTVTVGDPEVRPLPPLLPTATGNALLSGFMGTHKKKWGGKSAPEGEFTPPKWFFKGFGDWVRLPGEPLTVPANPVALIEEPEVALVYVNDADGTPHYAGYTFGNDLCDIGLHRQDPGYNPYCKLCDTALTPWLFLGEPCGLGDRPGHHRAGRRDRLGGQLRLRRRRPVLPDPGHGGAPVLVPRGTPARTGQLRSPGGR